MELLHGRKVKRRSALNFGNVSSEHLSVSHNIDENEWSSSRKLSRRNDHHTQNEQVQR